MGRNWQYMVPSTYMVKTTIYLDEDQANRLRSLSRVQGRPQAEIIREVLGKALQSPDRPKLRGFGKYSSGETNLSERVDEILQEAAKRGEWL